MLHLIKLCVGASSVDDLQASIDRRAVAQKAMGLEPFYVHTTRMTPKRRDELLASGSLYWVIKGKIQARQSIIDLVQFKDGEGISRCDIILDTKLVSTKWQARKAFQGWRYLKVEDAPADIHDSTKISDLELAQKLDELGLV